MHSELTPNQAKRLRSAFQQGIGIGVLAKRYDISTHKVKGVLENRILKDEHYEPPTIKPLGR
jgi:hypothetical protein